MRRKLFLLFFLFLLPFPQFAANDLPVILSMRDRAEVRDRWLAIRLQTVVPEIMRREGIDMWVIIAEGLKKALAAGNRLQDILMSQFVAGRSGNEILAKSLAQAKSESIVPIPEWNNKKIRIMLEEDAIFLLRISDTTP